MIIDNSNPSITVHIKKNSKFYLEINYHQDSKIEFSAKGHYREDVATLKKHCNEGKLGNNDGCLKWVTRVYS
jgi:hypothetical protein